MMKPLTKEQLDLVNEFKESRLNKKEFCKQKGIKLHQLDYLINKQQKLTKSESTFIKIKELNRDSSVVLNLNDLTITITNDVDDEMLRKIIRAARL